MCNGTKHLRCIHVCVLVCICLWPQWAVLGAKGQTVRQQSSLYFYLVDLSWLRGWKRWASCEMRQCTIMSSLYHHGNRNGRAEEHIRLRSHARMENDETQTSMSQSRAVFNHSLNVTQSPAVLQRVTLTDRCSETLQHANTEKHQEHALHHSSNTRTATGNKSNENNRWTLPKEIWHQLCVLNSLVKTTANWDSIIGKNMNLPDLGVSGSSFSCEHTTGRQCVSISYINGVGYWIKSLNTSEV